MAVKLYPDGDIKVWRKPGFRAPDSRCYSTVFTPLLGRIGELGRQALPLIYVNTAPQSRIPRLREPALFLRKISARSGMTQLRLNPETCISFAVHSSRGRGRLRYGNEGRTLELKAGGSLWDTFLLLKDNAECFFLLFL